MKHWAVWFVFGMLVSTGATAAVLLGEPSPMMGGMALGVMEMPMGGEIALPFMSAIAALGLVAGIRYIRNKRS